MAGQRARRGGWDRTQAQWEQHHVVDQRERSVEREGEDGRDGDDEDAGEHGEGAPLVTAATRREQREHGDGPGGELHGGRDAEHEPGEERAAALGQHHGEEEERDHRYVVAPGRQRQ